MATRLTAFVASALGREDVDRVYDDAICPVLRRLKINPRRIDRLNHNEDIDDKIISLIEQSDLCIADLTYARPSVYYESGYAAGQGKPVIYTARRDHLDRVKHDPHEHLRIHFDLQMKNIIPWSIPTSRFARAFEARIRIVSRPLLAAVRRREAAGRAETGFSSRPLTDQISVLTQQAWAVLRTRGFHLEDMADPRLRATDTLICTRVRNHVFQRVLLLGVSTVTQRLTRTLMLFSLFKSGRASNISSIENHIICASPTALARSKLRGELPHFRRLSDNALAWNSQRTLPVFPALGAFVHVLDRIKSENDLRARLRTLLEGFNLK